MKKIFSSLWIKHILVLCLIGTIIRLLFYLALAPADLGFSSHASEIMKAFFRGFRFDLSAVAYITLLFFPLIFFKQTPSPLYKLGLQLYRLLIYFWIAISVADILFYSFFTDRINLIAFGFMDDDTTSVLKIFWKNYPAIKITAAVFLLCLIAYWSTRRYLVERSREILNANWKLKTVLFVILFLCARGSLSLFPLGPDYAVISSVPFINHLSFGTGHALMRAAKLRSEQIRLGADNWDSNLKEFGYVGLEDKAFEDFFEKSIKSHRYDLMKFKTSRRDHRIDNVVLILMESWGTYGVTASTSDGKFDLIGKMRKHFEDDFLNINFIANTPGTAGSLSCLLAGIPQRAISPFLTESSYLNTPLSTSPALIYKKQGFETHFLYGGNPGWRDINKYAVTQGFDFIEGELEVRNTLEKKLGSKIETHDWGIHDEDLFKYIEIKLQEKTSKKKLYVVMTTTNHPPFELPTSYDVESIKNSTDVNNYPEVSRLIDRPLAQKRFRTFRYSSDKLADFMDTVKNSALKENTLVGATGDHSSWLINFNEDEIFNKDSVPFYLYVPVRFSEIHSIKEVFQTQFGGHMDIWPTLYNLSLSDAEYETFAQNMFEKKDFSFGLNAARFIASYNYAVVLNSHALSTYYQEPPTSLSGGFKNRYVPSPQKLEIHERLERKYKALMSALDSYLYWSKNPHHHQ